MVGLAFAIAASAASRAHPVHVLAPVHHERRILDPFGDGHADADLAVAAIQSMLGHSTACFTATRPVHRAT
jgi:sirohydrochlorin ferrochelatase